MGIKNLLKFLSEFPEIIIEKNITDFCGKKIAIDISILIYQVVIAIRNSGSDLTNDKGEITSHILGLFNKSLSFLEKGIIPVYVFDGKPPLIKQKLLNMRKQIRKKAFEKLSDAQTESEKIKYFKRCVWITKEQINQCRELLTLMGIPYIDAPEEADSQLSYLCKSNMVYAVLTEDMDILTFGSPKIIRNLMSSKKTPLEINLEDILTKLELSHEQFIELCILFGCDYCPNLSEIRTTDIYNLYIKYKSIDDTLLYLKDNNYITELIEYQEAKEYFITSKNNPVEESQLILQKPDTEKLLKLLVEKYSLIKYKIVGKLNKLEKIYEIYEKSLS
jgi:flap endonuclease-1